MGVKHMNKALALPLPTREKFVLVALSRYANNEDDTCYPGIIKLAELTGFCPKTVQRAVKTLSILEIIDVKSAPLGNNFYTLFLTGDIESWKEYLDSKSGVFECPGKEFEGKHKNSKSPYKEIQDKNEKINEKGVWVAGEGSPADKTTQIGSKTAEVDISIPPGKRLHELGKIWLEMVPKHYEGIEVEITQNDKWLLEEIQRKYAKVLPVIGFLRHTIIHWSAFVSRAKKDNSYKFKASPFPDLSFLLSHIQSAINLYMEWKMLD